MFEGDLKKGKQEQRGYNRDDSGRQRILRLEKDVTRVLIHYLLFFHELPTHQSTGKGHKDRKTPLIEEGSLFSPILQSLYR